MINIEITLVFAACENIFRVIFSALIYDSKVLRKILHSYLPYLEMFLLPLLLFFFCNTSLTFRSYQRNTEYQVSEAFFPKLKKPDLLYLDGISELL